MGRQPTEAQLTGGDRRFADKSRFAGRGMAIIEIIEPRQIPHLRERGGEKGIISERNVTCGFLFRLASRDEKGEEKEEEEGGGHMYNSETREALKSFFRALFSSSSSFL